jgi:hypothetical protein
MTPDACPVATPAAVTTAPASDDEAGAGIVSSGGLTTNR